MTSYDRLAMSLMSIAVCVFVHLGYYDLAAGEFAVLVAYCTDKIIDAIKEAK